ncbi:MAG: aminotransferase class V-fold PLP-dependent enzyme [Terriglobia bacterium]|nr:aminotransferase class V-fold PLP-dependent enzyme [Terriglobia bacterium]
MSRLNLSPEQYRKLANRAVDLTTVFLQQLPTAPSFPETSGEETNAIFDLGLPEEPLGEAAFDDFARVLELSRQNTPRFFGYVLGSGEPVGAIADLVASVLNQNVTSWRSGPAAATIERTVVRWLGEFIGCRGFSGSLTGGGSSANLMGLAMAREAKAPANDTGAQPVVIYTSSEVHMSVPKAAALLGLGYNSIRYIGVDERFRMKVDELEKAIREDRGAGKRPIAIVGSAGTTATGSIDPLDELATIASANDLWFHVDGAYGAFAASVAPDKFRGLSRADSLSLDAHKWLYQPLDCGCLLYRNPTAAQRAFSHSGDYTKVLSSDPIEGFAFFEESMELSRRFRALKIWLSLRYHGAQAFRDSIAEDLRLALHLASVVGEHDKLDLLAPVELSAVCFRYRPEANSEDEVNAVNAEIVKRSQRAGRVFFSNAMLNGKFALRACITNHRSTQKDVEEVVREVMRLSAEI